MELVSFADIATKYKTIFFDAYGVLKNHKGLIPGIVDTFQFLDDNGIDYYVITNDASRGPIELAQDYENRGLHRVKKDKIISSGMLARDYLKLKVNSGTVAYLGTPESAHYIETLGLKTVSITDLDLNDAQEVSALVFLDDEGYDWNQEINKTINLLRKVNIPTIVSNTDRYYPVTGHEVAIATGGIANMVEDIVRKHFIRFGKPDAQMFIFAYEHSVKHGGTDNKREILMVGDTLSTDIIGGNKFGLDTLLVLSGNTLPDQVELKIRTEGIIPTYVAESAVVTPDQLG